MYVPTRAETNARKSKGADKLAINHFAEETICAKGTLVYFCHVSAGRINPCAKVGIYYTYNIIVITNTQIV